jgi:hypothetical protein
MLSAQNPTARDSYIARSVFIKSQCVVFACRGYVHCPQARSSPRLTRAYTIARPGARS